MRNLGKNKTRCLLFIWIIGALFFVTSAFMSIHPVFAKDLDHDGVDDTVDNCPDQPNPYQFDLDGDGIGLACDRPAYDQDSDGVADGDDNCIVDPNPYQFDLDGDGIGLVCDTENDPDSDGITNDGTDNCPNKPNPLQYDFDSDGFGIICDADDGSRRYLLLEENTQKARIKRINMETDAFDNLNRYLAFEKVAGKYLIPKPESSRSHDQLNRLSQK